MQTEALLNTTRRGEELKYVTTHFQDLQGLRLAPLWTALLILTGVAITNRLPPWQLPTAAFLIVALGFAWFRWSGGWYQRRYGIVTSPEPAVPSGIISIMNPEPKPRGPGNYNSVRILNLFILCAYILPEFFSRSARHFGEFALLIVAYIVLPRCLYPATGNPFIRLRKILPIAVSILIFGAYFTQTSAVRQKWTYLAAVCASMLLLDLYDHWLFTRLLKGSPAGITVHREETWVPDIERIVHEPARLAILAVLSSCERADFLFLERATRLTRGNLSVQLTRLEEAGLIEIWKTIERKRTLTTAALTDRGRKMLASYWQAMETLRNAAVKASKGAAKSPRPGRRIPERLKPATT